MVVLSVWQCQCGQMEIFYLDFGQPFRIQCGVGFNTNKPHLGIWPVWDELFVSNVLWVLIPASRTWTLACLQKFSYRSNSSLQISSLLGIHFHGQDERSTHMRLWKRLIKGTFDGVSPKARNLQSWSGWERQNLWHTAREQVIGSWNIDVWKL
jgi:hypothetical protein